MFFGLDFVYKINRNKHPVLRFYPEPPAYFPEKPGTEKKRRFSTGTAGNSWLNRKNRNRQENSRLNRVLIPDSKQFYF